MEEIWPARDPNVEGTAFRSLSFRTKPVGYFAESRIRGKYCAAGRSPPSALDAVTCSVRRARARIPRDKKVDA
jgi:hypothetical protein